MSNFYITPEDWTRWVARDEWTHYMYDRLEKGYLEETLTEEEYKKRYVKKN